MKKLYLIFALLVGACAPYVSPDRLSWSEYLYGASLTDMTEISRAAKRPVYLGAGGRVIDDAIIKDAQSEYGDKNMSDNAINIAYMSKVEYTLYDALRKAGISVQRAGSEVVVILVRDAIMRLDAPEISETGDDTLKIIEKILNKYDATYIEIAGYTDSMRDTNASQRLSMDMAQRVAVHMSKNHILPTRMFIVGRGSSRPIAGQDDIGRLTNRRIEIRIAPAR